MKKRICVQIGSLFKKYLDNTIIKIRAAEPAWRSIHAANAAIMTPGERPDEKWRIYIRGSGNVPDYHDLRIRQVTLLKNVHYWQEPTD